MPLTLQNWFSSYIERVSALPALGGSGITLDPVRGVQVSPDASDEAIQGAVTMLSDTREKNRVTMFFMDRFIGQLIIAWADRHDSDWSTAISELNLAETTGKSFKTLVKLPRIASTVPDELYHLPNITTTTLDVATSFAGPIDDYQKMAQFNEKRWDMVRSISESPEEWTKAKMVNEMRNIQLQFDVKPRRLIPLSFIMDRFMKTSIMLVNYTEADWERLGVERSVAVEHWESWRNDLIDRGRIDSVEESEVLPWNETIPDIEPPVLDVDATTDGPAVINLEESQDGH
jgi:hypothetical protein